MRFLRPFIGIFLLVLVSVIGYTQPSAKQLFQDAEGRFRNREYEFALDRYDSLLKEYPLSEYIPDAQFQRSMCLYRLGRPQEAYPLLQRIEVRYASTRYISFVPFWKGVIEFERGDYDSAIRSFAEYIETGETSLRSRGHLYKALAEKEGGYLADAGATLEELFPSVAVPEEEPYALSLLASIYIQRNAYDDLYELFRDVEPGRAVSEWRDSLSFYKAEALWRVGRRDDAERLYAELVDGSPMISSIAYRRLFTLARIRNDDEGLRTILHQAETGLVGMPEILREFWLRIGIESYKQDKRDLAAAYFRKILDLGSLETTDGLVILYYATILYEDGDSARAVDVINDYLAVSADQRDLLLLRRGSILLSRGEWIEAAADFETFTEDYPDHQSFGEAAYLSAFAGYKSGNTVEALALVRTVYASGKAGGYSAKLLRLESVLHVQTGNQTEAVRALETYVRLVPDDNKARIDLAKLYFSEGRFSLVLTTAAEVFSDDALELSIPGDLLVLHYLSGLSLITMKEYDEALEHLDLLTLAAVRSSDLIEIYPYVLFYRGWSQYRLARYEQAKTVFAEFLRGAPDHPLTAKAAYLAGWCAYSTGDFADAERFFRAIPVNAEGGINEKGMFMYGKALIGLSRIGEAAAAYENLFIGYPDSAFADDAIFEYAAVLADIGEIDDALAQYDRIVDEYAGSPLAEEAIYRKGELLYGESRFAEARDAFYRQRVLFPRGDLLDASLYWGGLASDEAGEDFGAVLLWEKLIQQFKESPFRSDAMRRTAEIYEATGDYREAFKLYSELIALYPKVAAAVRADEKAEKLRFLLLGQSDREAELSVIIGRENGSITKAGRAAIIELSRYYIYMSGEKQDTARKMLQEVVKREDEDPASAAFAHNLLGEYYYRKNVLDRAANEFLAAAATDPANRDLMASSLLRAAEMTKLSGDMKSTKELVERITKNFPDSQWASEGAKLLEDAR